jgi:5-methylcytosine-specific restriction endonuclease McrBC GTP-binding regulatory subunit McrB
MNLARVEYYFADLLSILEMPDRDEWLVDIVPSAWPNDPKKLVNGKLRLPGNLWYIGTINNDESTFMVTDKVYDRAMPIDINIKVDPFKCREQEAIDINASYLESLFDEAKEKYPLSDKGLKQVKELDDYIIKHFRIAFGNRIMKQLNVFASVYVATGGKEIEAIDYFVAKKILRKFDQLSVSFLRDEIDPFISYLNKNYGKGTMKECIEYLENTKKNL